ncbi:hypothetical protein AOL_s00043g223 [Orbilia oligospora ATCC 24927]|uniref:Rhodopsin domain-containing protein n=2 Tax=Orbilia oligospora TaxID=2813651 RepID=G1X3F0_ARTOA|nr:hypothetical protein AOL_s00043g223 [Orbilia oligospora ATCC 24927]EGX52434.1 hypothetical protein AOL_s00043g223 [Orbilia oligospora ATCC 24927]KAF3289309.1 hypothetical protein TWF970_003089 [Orbilia oligospora]
MLSPPNPQTDADRAYILSMSPLFRKWPENFEFPLVTVPGYRPPSNTLYSVIISFIIVSITAAIVVARFWARWRSLGTCGMDDWVMVPTFLFYIAFNVVNIYAVFGTGFGFHLYDLSLKDIRGNLLVTYLHVIFSFAALHLCRISIQHLLLRLTPLTSRTRRWYLYILLTLSYLFGTAAVVTQIFQCGLPLSNVLNFRKAFDGTCVSLYSTTVYGVFMTGHILLDALTLFPPIYILIKLPTMSKSNKYNLTFLLMLGGITMILSALKPFVFYRRMMNSYDITWTSTHVGFIGIIELSLALIVASLPALNRHIIKFKKKLFGDGGGASKFQTLSMKFGVIRFTRRDKTRRSPPKSLSYTTTGATLTANKDVMHSYLELGDMKSEEQLRCPSVEDIERGITVERDFHVTSQRISAIQEEIIGPRQPFRSRSMPSATSEVFVVVPPPKARLSA